MHLFTQALVLLNLASISFSCKVKTYKFYWRGQFAGMMVKGKFVYDMERDYEGGIVREGDLLDLRVNFYDPQGNLLKVYAENQNAEHTNFAYSIHSNELLQDGTWNVDDDTLFYRNGFNMGEGSPDLRYENGVQSGMAFWSRPADTKTPHLHVDDWNDAEGNGEFGFPIAYSSHEDASFMYKTTQEAIDGGKVGSSYYSMFNGTITNNLASDVKSYGQTVRIENVKPSNRDRNLCKTDDD